MRVEHADHERSLSAIEHSVRHAPPEIQVALQKRRAEMGLPPLRLGWTVGEARAAIEAKQTAIRRWKAAVARATKAAARMNAAAKG
jgi:hypothetical protein